MFVGLSQIGINDWDALGSRSFNLVSQNKMINKKQSTGDSQKLNF